MLHHTAHSTHMALAVIQYIIIHIKCAIAHITHTISRYSAHYYYNILNSIKVKPIVRLDGQVGRRDPHPPLWGSGVYILKDVTRNFLPFLLFGHQQSTMGDICF